MSAKSPNSLKTDGSNPGPPPAADAPPAARSGRRDALLRVGEDGVGFRRLLELLFGGLVAGISVRVIFHRELAIGALQFDCRSPCARRPAPRSSRVCSRLGHLHHCRPQQPIAHHVAAPHLADHFALAMPRTGFVRRPPDADSGRNPRRSPRSGDALLAQQIVQLGVNQLHAFSIGRAIVAGVTVSARSKSSTTGSSSSSRSVTA